MKTILLACLGLVSSPAILAQCLSAPTYPSVVGNEPLIVNSDVIGVSQAKWNYGTRTVNDAALRGGTLIVSGDLTLNNFTFDSGILVIQPGSRAWITNSSTVQLKGGCYIYNFGTFQCNGNLTLDWGVTSATRPNIAINATSTSQFLMAFTYLTINNPWSRFVNNGYASLGGLISDYNSVPASVCLGDRSIMDMQVLLNNIKHPYTIPFGAACVRVTSYSQLRDTLCSSPNLAVCLGPGVSHCTSTGCRPNAWGTTAVATNCASCNTWLSTVLAPSSFSISGRAANQYNFIQWQYNGVQDLTYFLVQRSADGNTFDTIDSLIASAATNYKDYTARAGLHYYRIVGKDKDGHALTSSTIAISKEAEDVYPNPFRQSFTIKMHTDAASAGIIVYDATGKTVRPRQVSLQRTQLVIDGSNLPAGVYTVCVQLQQSIRSYKLLKL